MEQRVMSEREIRKEYSTIKGALLYRCPFIGSLISAARLVVTKSVPTAAVDKGRTIYINPEFWSRLSDSEKLGVIAHEVLHLAFRHTWRAEQAKYDQSIYNLAADAQVNHILKNENFTLPEGCFTLHDASSIVEEDVEKLARMTADSIYKLLKEKMGMKKIKIRYGDGWGGGGCGGNKGGGYGGDKEYEIPGIGKDLRPDLGGSEKEGGGEERKPEDWDKYWADAVARAAVVAKQVGRLPAGIERLFDILKPKVNWRSALRTALESGLGSKVVTDWRRPGRKNPDMPGVKRLGIRRGWIMVDCSGSIDEETLSQFAGEVYDIAKRFNVELVVLPWDVEVYDPQKVRRPSDIMRVKFKGFGGTEIRKAAEKVAKDMRPLDFVVILSDGYIWDLRDSPSEETLNYLARIAARASAAVFVSTIANDLKLPPRWRFIKVD